MIIQCDWARAMDTVQVSIHTTLSVALLAMATAVLAMTFFTLTAIRGLRRR